MTDVRLAQDDRRNAKLLEHLIALRVCVLSARTKAQQTINWRDHHTIYLCIHRADIARAYNPSPIDPIPTQRASSDSVFVEARVTTTVVSPMFVCEARGMVVCVWRCSLGRRARVLIHIVYI